MKLKQYVMLFMLIMIMLALGYGCAKRVTTEIVLPEGKTAKIVFVVGEVFVRPVNESGWLQARVGDVITEGARC